MKKTQINKTDIDWIDVKDKCRTTVNKGHSEADATEKFKRQLLISEHSPIRLLKVNWLWQEIKSWCATHFSRHHIGWEKWIGTRRSDRTGVNRGELSQDEVIPMEVEANAQALVNVGRVRLCFQASKETREYMEDLKCTLHNNEETKEIADVIVPNCIYRNGCPEFQPCKFFDNFQKEVTKEELCDIQTRYNLYNEKFYDQHSEQTLE